MDRTCGFFALCLLPGLCPKSLPAVASGRDGGPAALSPGALVQRAINAGRRSCIPFHTSDLQTRS